MRLLIDECLSPALATMAQAAGFEASHVVWLGLAGSTDRALMPTILAGDWTFATRNAVDFRGPASRPGSRGLHARTAIHAGLICLNGPPGMDLALQRELFEAALDELLRDGDLINTVLELTVDGVDIVAQRYRMPES